ncbi:MAG: DNA polymerase III subunit delta [Clostridia bacterium]|nr:DNA polymerase III subunit delta [Clostridia bacterium]
MAYEKKVENDFRSFSKDLKENNIKGVICFHGQEDFLIDWAIEQLVKRYVAPGFEALDYVKVTEDMDVMENLEMATMMSEKRVVVAKGFKGEAPSYDGDNILVLIGDKVKGVKDYSFDRLDVRELYSFISKRLRAKGIDIGRDELAFMVDISGYYNKESGYRLTNFENDIKKLIALCDGEKVTRENISQAMNGDLDTFIFDFIESLSSRNKDKSFRMLDNLLSTGTSFFSLVALITNQFEMMLEILELEQQGMNMAGITKELKIHEFRVKKAYSACKHFTIDRLKEMLINLYDIDTSVKSGNMDQRTALELFIAKI